MRGVRVTHKGESFQFEQVPRSYTLLMTLLNANFTQVKVEAISSLDFGGMVIRSDEDLANVYAACSRKGATYCELQLEGKERRSFCCSKLRDQKLPKAKNEDEKEAGQLYGKMPCFKCASSKSGTCRTCGGSGEISVQANTKYRSLLQTVQKAVESLIKRIQILREVRCREKREGVHEGYRCRMCGATPIIGVRYQCPVCVDFSICWKCEEMMQHQHFFIKVRAPKAAKGENASLVLRFVKDVVGKEGDSVVPGELFPKVWRIRNDGEIAFPPGCVLVYTNGDISGDQVPIPALQPGEECDLAVECTAPQLEGRYTSFWRAVTSDGVRFGQRISIDVMVVQKQEEQISEVQRLKEVLRTKPAEIQRALLACKGDVAAALRELEEGRE